MKSPEYIIHGTSSETDAQKIIDEGFRAEEGRATVSADLIMAFKWASDQSKRKASKSESPVSSDENGRIVIMKNPEYTDVDYGEDTDIAVDDNKKVISGFTSRYQSARRYLALYNKYEDQNPEIKVPKENILMSIVPTPELVEKINELKQKIKNLEKIRLIDFTEELVSVIKSNKDNVVPDNIHEIIGNLLVSTIESEVMAMVRAVSLEVKRAKDYKIFNKGEDITQEKVVDEQTLKVELEKYKILVESREFDLGIESLNRYLRLNINKLLKEIDAKE